MRRLDIRGLIQPFSFLKVSHAVKELGENEMLEIVLGGPDTASELFKILPAASYAILSMAEEKNKDGFRLQLKKISPKEDDGKPYNGNILSR